MTNIFITKKSQTPEGLVISGVATTNSWDTQGERITITPNSLKKAWPEFSEKGAPMYMGHCSFGRKDGKPVIGREDYGVGLFGGKIDMDFGRITFDPSIHYWVYPEYQDRQVGKVLNMEFVDADKFDLDSPNPLPSKISFVALISDPKAIEDIENGELDATSFSWQPLNWLARKGNKSDRVDTEIKICELTLTNSPANPDAKIETFKKVTDEDLEKQFFSKGELVATKTMTGLVEDYYQDQEGKVFVKLNSSKSLIEVSSVKAAIKSYGCVMAMYEPKQFEKFWSQIEKADLYQNPEDELQDGLGKNPHTTIFYGLLPEVTKEQILAKNNFSGLYNTRLEGKQMTIFSRSPDYDVLVVEMDKDENLVRANSQMGELPNENRFPDYLPHTTIAYLKKGSADKYTNLDYSGIDFTVKDITFSGADDGEKYDSLLEKKANPGNFNFFTRQELLAAAKKYKKPRLYALKGLISKPKAVNQEEIDEVFKKYHELVNMSASELEEWSENPKSRVASLSREPIERNLRLLRKPKDEWTSSDARGANRTISYISRAKEIGKGKITKESEPFGRNEIALRNWAFKL